MGEFTDGLLASAHRAAGAAGQHRQPRSLPLPHADLWSDRVV
jgi:hypothetical protein